MAMGICRVVRFIDIDLFYGGFHVELLVKDEQALSEPVADVKSGFACERWLLLRYSVHPIGEMRSRVAIGVVPHTVVKGGTHCRIEILSVAK
uniref:Uncharacterized protein n=1 Tax=Romanomermis culicivorax TaxID=13658 RepID=A0A915IK28_ROMCU